MAIAITHAHALEHLEASLGINVEASWQRAFAHSPLLWVCSHIYLLAQFVATPVALIALYFKAPAIYRWLRDTLLCGWLIALPVYALYVCAPPRLAGIGVSDTVSASTGINLNSPTISSLYDRYAAMPSMHVGFAFAVGAALFCACSRYRRWRWLALAWGPVVTLSVIVTGNHFVLDAVAGVAVIACAYALTQYLRPWIWRRRTLLVKCHLVQER
jgi:membrane-associated phospholipid phosphatase